MPKQKCESAVCTYNTVICNRHQSVWRRASLFVCCHGSVWCHYTILLVKMCESHTKGTDSGCHSALQDGQGHPSYGILYYKDLLLYTIINNPIWNDYNEFWQQGWSWIKVFIRLWILPYLLTTGLRVCTPKCALYKTKKKIWTNDTIPFQKHQVIHQQYFNLSSVTKIPHCE